MNSVAATSIAEGEMFLAGLPDISVVGVGKGSTTSPGVIWNGEPEMAPAPLPIP